MRPEWLIVRIGDEERLFWYDRAEDAYACGDSSTRYPVVNLEQFHNGMVPVWYDYLDLSEALPNASADAPRE